jgi:hypothetical protein
MVPHWRPVGSRRSPLCASPLNVFLVTTSSPSAIMSSIVKLRVGKGVRLAAVTIIWNVWRSAVAHKRQVVQLVVDVPIPPVLDLVDEAANDCLVLLDV